MLHTMLDLKYFTIFALFMQNTLAYIEYVEITKCESCTMMLTCRHLNSVIAVFNASFHAQDQNSTYYQDFDSLLPPVHPRLALNRRCSGVNHCSFILIKDCPGADRWGPGNFTIKYACVADRRISKYCNHNISLPSPEVFGVSEGFIRNPGYPKFYLGGDDCRWRISAPPMQKIKLTILDLSLIGTSNSPESCLDVFEVKEYENKIFVSCLEQEPPAVIVSVGDVLEINLRATENLIAKRGVLFHYTAIGCPTPNSPADGYLVHRNDTDVLFTCCVGFAFPDSLQREKRLKCLGHSWNYQLPLPNCINQTKDLFSRETKQPSTGKMTEESLSDVVVPSIIILALFVINSIIVFVIYKYKKRKTALYTEEELGTISVERTCDLP
ncbi:PREDICTED: uncharacterized protein LOC108561440 [Nicrophorus vespilloides]|uniref:Uncharacterized protein LOC108561440 n=1 Tax=Nicrophorus vespilloides TaxID=110193 RepID=A0ABM1MJW4_NICVS|nr:PREDICTED: uncharacterized protein LOC108561440 [Nicrophorus vespilloides]